MRILCVCNGGNVRSVTLGRLLRKRGFEVLTTGVDKTHSDETLLMLFHWADIIFFQKDAYQKLESRPELPNGDFDETGYRVKGDFRFDVGKDDWKIPQHPELLSLLRPRVIKWMNELNIGDKE